MADWIHSVDSLALLGSIKSHAEQLGRCPRLLIEVNISGDQDKHGFRADELLDQWPALVETSPVPIAGLMAMSGLDATQEQTQRQFAEVSHLRDRLQQLHGAPLPELSLGMSSDFREAICEGATMVRIGSRLFEGIAS